MASDYEYMGVVNNQHEFKEISTGQYVRVLTGGDDETISLLDADVVVIQNSRGDKRSYSLKEGRFIS